MTRVHNFNAGPAALPEAVLAEAQAELLDWRGRGLSVMEMSHRSPAFAEIAGAAEADLRALLAIPDSYAVLFLQGGATLQFAAVPMNLAAPESQADYLVTGAWSKKAAGEGARFVDARVAWSGAEDRFTMLPPAGSWAPREDAAYVHLCWNETIHGVAFRDVPETGDVPVVCDVSSSFLSEPMDVERFGVLYAGAQKNIGPAGLTVLIVRKDLLGRARDGVPMVMDWSQQADKGSMLNTPPCWAWYVAGLVFRRLREEGGLDAMAARNARKAEHLYAYVDASPFYVNPVAPDARSRMNVPFTLARDDLDASFLKEAEAAGLHGLKGHRSVGGMRASIYNAVTEASVDALLEFMDTFAKKHG